MTSTLKTMISGVNIVPPLHSFQTFPQCRETISPHIALIRFIHCTAHTIVESIWANDLGRSFRYVAIVNHDRSELRSHIVMAFCFSIKLHKVLTALVIPEFMFSGRRFIPEFMFSGRRFIPEFMFSGRRLPFANKASPPDTSASEFRIYLKICDQSN